LDTAVLTKRDTGGQTMKQLQKDQEFLQAAQATLEAGTREMVTVSNRLHDNLVKAMRLMWRQLLFIWAVMILLLVAYFFILSKPAPVTKVAGPDGKTPEQAGQTSAAVIPSQVPPTPPLMQSASLPEWEEINGILEQIRSGQLKKDLHLIIKAYSPYFPNIGQKKENILRTWQQYDFLEMHYNIDNVQKLNDHTIIAKVVWDITLEDLRSRKKSSLLKEYTIHFSDVSGKWLIQELILSGKNSEMASGST
jgi:hypothetical protein